MTTLYGSTRTIQLFNKLVAFAGHAAVQGEVLEVDGNSTIATAYTAWNSDVTNVAKANDTAAAIRAVILNYLAAHPSVQYIVMVGDDRVIPMRRIVDRTGYPENRYTSLIATTTVGAAIADNYFLTDDYYADQQPVAWQGAEVYVPDWAIGRLVETPEEIGNMLDTFMASSELTLGGATGVKALVVGYDFVQDVATHICELLSQDLANSNRDCTLISNAWSSTEFREKQLNANPPFKFQSINGHANHTSEGAPIGNSVTAYNVVSGTSDLSGAVIYSVGCHAGLNVPETSNFPLDLPQAFAFKRANYVANTGFGWGSRIDVQFTERVMQNYTQELLKGTTATIGKALTSAKQRYFQEATNFEERDEKVMQQVVLYGLPMYRVNTGDVLGDNDPFPSAVISTTFPTQSNAARPDQIAAPTGKGSVSINIAGDAAARSNFATTGGGFTPVTTTWGNYYQLDGHTDTQAVGPIQPRFYTRLTPPAGQQLRGAVFTSGSYYTSTLDPVINVGVNEYLTVTSEPVFQTDGFYPPVPFVFRANDEISRTDKALAVVLGQYDSAGGIERLYNNVQYDVYYSTLADAAGPTISAIDGFYNTQTSEASFKVEATDSYTVTRVLIAYTTGVGTWSSLDLIYNSATQKWAGILPGIRGASYYVQAVDGAGNATAVSRRGGYFSLAEVSLDVQEYNVYVPLVVR